jgi:hypothetical protein
MILFAVFKFFVLMFKKSFSLKVILRFKVLVCFEILF